MLKRDYPVLIDGSPINMIKLQWSRSFIKVVNTATTEAGTDDEEVLRSDKTTIAAKFRGTDTWARFFAQKNEDTDMEVSFYDVKTDDYITKTMRIRDLVESEIKDSERLEVTNGTYDISFKLVEF